MSLEAQVAGRNVTFFVPLAKMDNEKRMVYGYASTEAKDSDGEIVTRKAIEGALPDYMKFANIREMHQLSAVGVAKTADMDEKGLWLGAKIVDDDAWNKVKEGVYKGFSIGGSATTRSGNQITGLSLIEISLVDRPACPEALIECYKRASDPEPDPEPAQTWDCGFLGHTHVKKDEAIACMKAHKASEPGAAKARRLLGEAINALDDHGVTQALAAFTKSANKPENKEGEPKTPAENNDALAGTFAARILQTDLSKVDTLDVLAKALGCAPEMAKAALAKARGNYTAIGNVPPPALVALIDRVMKDQARDDHGRFASGSGAGKEDDDPDAHSGTSAREREDMMPDEWDKTKKGKKKDGEGEGDKPYGDVTYADPGYQSDGKKRYPIDTEEHIRAAWNYINKPKNAGKYSPEHVASIKSRIVAAWKEHIDKDGPPSAGEKAAQPQTKETTLTTAALKALGEPDAKGSLKKGLLTAAMALGLLERLDDLGDCLKREAEVEGDNSPLPARMENVRNMMADVAKSLVEEEIGEMLNNTEMKDIGGWNGDMAMPVCFAAAATKAAGGKGLKKMASRLEDIIGDNTGAPGYTQFATIVELMEKAETAAQTQEWGAFGLTSAPDSNDDWQKVHDVSCTKGAKCPEAKKSATAPAKNAPKGSTPQQVYDYHKAAFEFYKNAKTVAKAAGDADAVTTALVAMDHHEEQMADAAIKAKKGDHNPPKKPAGNENNDGEEDGDNEDAQDGGDDEGEEDQTPPKKKKKAAQPTGADELLKQFQTLLAPISEGLTTLKGTVEDIQSRTRNPASPKGTLRVVGKGEQVAGTEQPPAAKDTKAEDVLKACLADPHVATTHRV